MPPPPTWQISPAPGGHFRWSAAAAAAAAGGGGADPHSPTHRLPSMSDLLLQATRPSHGAAAAPATALGDQSIRCARSADPGASEGDGEEDGVGMFRTGLGKSVTVRQSSVRKAAAVLGGEIVDKVVEGSGEDGCVPMFHTGLGNSVAVRQSSMRKAAAILGGEAVEKGHLSALEGTGVNGCAPMFRTGSGNAVAVRQSSIRKAAIVLEGEPAEKGLNGTLPAVPGSNEDERFPIFSTGLGNSVTVRQSSLRKAATVLGGGAAEKGYLPVLESSGEDGSVPLFHTRLGNSVAIRQSSVRKAATVLGGEAAQKGSMPVLQGSNEDGSLPMFRNRFENSVAVRQSSIRKAAVLGEEGDLAVIEGRTETGHIPMFCTGSGKSVAVRQSSIEKVAAIFEGKAVEEEPLPLLEGNRGNGCVPMFRTGSGNSVAVRQSSIRKAAAVLGGEAVEKVLERSGEEAPVPIFRTGLGNSFAVRQSSIRKAAAVLEGEAVEIGPLPVLEGKREAACIPLFCTGSGKSVAVRQSSLRKAAAVLQGEAAKKDTWNRDHAAAGTRDADSLDIQSANEISCTVSGGFYTPNNHSFRSSLQNTMVSELHEADSAQPQIKFHTAGGRSISISTDALQRAKSLLGDSERGVTCNDLVAQQPLISFSKVNKIDDTSWNKENLSFACQNATSNHVSPALSHVRSLSNPKQLSSLCVDRLRIIPEGKPLGGPLVEISNIGAKYVATCQLSGEKKRPGRRTYVSPFKKPRISRFTTPLNSSISVSAIGSSALPTPENHCRRTKVSTHYPFIVKRKAVKEFFGCPPLQQDLYRDLPNDLKHMNPSNAERYKFLDASDLHVAGPEAFQNMLLQAGASLLDATKEWVANHYKWIVWKLASYERSYPDQTCNKYLTVSNVLEELKYRYEREFNYGHRSALRRILDGDASPASMMVLCVSATFISSKQNLDEMADSKKQNTSSLVESNYVAKIQLTDGWYSLDAFVDALLSKQLVAGKLFVGQKLRICGAGLCGWAGPISPLEATKTVSLQMHINGTYRAHWADPLGFCKGTGAPLAFRCIKGSGGKVSRTLVGVTRLYPILFKERFSDGGSIVRSDVMEQKALQLYNGRRSKITEDIWSEQKDTFVDTDDNEEGAKIFKILENAAEPEMIMADMSSEQLISFSTFQAKQEATRQSDMQKKVEKALVDAGLDSREVSPFMRLRVVGLTSKYSSRKERPREGLITIWNPTEEQKVNLLEGKVYLVSGLMPLNFGAETLYLQTRGSSSVWKSLPSSETEKFESFFSPRKAVLLSNLGDVPLTSEFDLAAVVVHIGDVYISGRQKKQWIFTTDGSGCSLKLHGEEPDDCLLAISFCSPVIDNDSSPIISQSVSGTTVGFFNLVKRTRDQVNHIWVAEATENSTYTVCYKLPYGSHLKEAADSTTKWAKGSSLVIQMLKERALCIIGSDGD